MPSSRLPNLGLGDSVDDAFIRPNDAVADARFDFDLDLGDRLPTGGGQPPPRLPRVRPGDVIDSLHWNEVIGLIEQLRDRVAVVEALTGRVTTLETRANALQTQVTAHQGRLTALEARVTALEPDDDISVEPGSGDVLQNSGATNVTAVARPVSAVPNIGLERTEQLGAAGIPNLSALAKAPVGMVAEALGFSRERAAKVIEDAKRLMGQT